MAFNRQDMARVASASTGAQANWLYRTEDLTSEILSTGYFDKSFTDLKVDDLIQVKNGQGYTLISILTSSHQGVTVEKTTFLGEITPLEILAASSLATQDPGALDTPLQVEFGPAQGGPSDPVQMDANGLLTINETGVYGMRTIFSVSRTTSPGTAYIFVRFLIDNVQLGNPIAAVLSEDDITIPLELTFTGFLLAGTQVRAEFYRDSQGNDDGSLEPRTSTIGWGQSPSASARIQKFG